MRRKPLSARMEPLEPPRRPGDRLINRHRSWLDFNARVLALAEDDTVPPLERARYLAIFAENLDQFHMTRVAELRRREATRLATRSADGLTSGEQLKLINQAVTQLIKRQAHCFRKDVGPALAREGVSILHWHELPGDTQEHLHYYFHTQVFPVLTPLEVDPAYRFPYSSGLSLNLAVRVRVPGDGAHRFARVKVPQNMPRLVRVGLVDQAASDVMRSAAAGAEGTGRLIQSGDATACYVPLEEVIEVHLQQLFPGMEVVEARLFRVTRDAALEVEEDEDLLLAMERELSRRRFGPAVRLEVDDSIDDDLLDLLMRELEISDREVYRINGLLDLSTLNALYDLDRPELKHPPHLPATHHRLITEAGGVPDFFSVLQDGDVLVHHPYDSFATSVQRFIEEAAADPKVLAIKQTLYRTSGDSPIVDALVTAAEAGKQVVVLVEIKARFDETANIRWARALERAGCHVVYGVIGLKTHCKTCLVVRQERTGLRRYCHIGTGNYNPRSALFYEDLSLLTANPAVGDDITDLFSALTGYSRQTKYRTLLVAPHDLRSGLVTRIEDEIAAARAGRPSGVRLKVNRLADRQMIDALYRASRARVPVHCLVRDVCSMRPGIPRLSESVHIRSIVGRFLEHSRVFEFRSSDEYWIGSADITEEKLDRRIEVFVPVTQPDLRGFLRAMLDHAFSDTVNAWVLKPDGTWLPPERSPGNRRMSDYQVDRMSRPAGYPVRPELAEV